MNISDIIKSLYTQRAFYNVNGDIIINTPISTSMGIGSDLKYWWHSHTHIERTSLIDRLRLRYAIWRWKKLKFDRQNQENMSDKPV